MESKTFYLENWRIFKNFLPKTTTSAAHLSLLVSLLVSSTCFSCSDWLKRNWQWLCGLRRVWQLGFCLFRESRIKNKENLVEKQRVYFENASSFICTTFVGRNYYKKKLKKRVFKKCNWVSFALLLGFSSKTGISTLIIDVDSRSLQKSKKEKKKKKKKKKKLQRVHQTSFYYSPW